LNSSSLQQELRLRIFNTINSISKSPTTNGGFLFNKGIYMLWEKN